jgi:hypothetical protein
MQAIFAKAVSRLAACARVPHFSRPLREVGRVIER